MIRLSISYADLTSIIPAISESKTRFNLRSAYLMDSLLMAFGDIWRPQNSDIWQWLWGSCMLLPFRSMLWHFMCVWMNLLSCDSQFMATGTMYIGVILNIVILIAQLNASYGSALWQFHNNLSMRRGFIIWWLFSHHWPLHGLTQLLPCQSITTYQADEWLSTW